MATSKSLVMVPEGWAKSTIGEHVDLLTGFAFKSADYTADKGDVCLLRGDNIGQGFLRWRNAKRWSRNAIDGLEKYQLQAGDFVIAMDRTWIPAGVKISEVSEEDLPCLLVQRVSRLRSKTSLEQTLLRQIFSSNSFEQYVKKIQTETAVPHISPKDIRQFPILVPPKIEQIGISEILSTWDHAIDIIEKMIDNTEQQKKALMQLFFSTQSSKEWPLAELGSLGTFRKGRGISRSEVVTSGIPCVRYGEIYTQHHDVILSFTSFVTEETASAASKIEPGDLLFTASGETADEIGKCVAFLGDHEAYAGGDIIIFSPQQGHPAFLAYQLNDSTIIRQRLRFAQGQSVVHISARNLAKIEVRLPSLSAQKRIASTLSDLDWAAKGFREQKRLLVAEKSALMQQLLAGKRRVRVDADRDHDIADGAVKGAGSSGR